MHHNMRTDFDPYKALERSIAARICPDAEDPCCACQSAAFRIVANRKVIREMLTEFAHEEALRAF